VGYSDTLAAIHQTLSPEELHEYLMLIARNGRKMSNIINELLLFASMRRKDIPFKPLNMAAIVEEALRRLDYEVQTVEAEIIKPESFPRAVGHAAWVEEVWFNYISNGLKYGGRPPRLELGSTILDDGTIQFWVQDNGGGLSESQQGVVFTPPSQTGILRVQGHGLGLSIVRRIVDKLNGRVFVESQMEKGSRFGFILPASPEEPDTSEPDS
jgi:signal transduction histidine kinase